MDMDLRRLPRTVIMTSMQMTMTATTTTTTTATAR
jgi:hypothetical protein